MIYTVRRWLVTVIACTSGIICVTFTLFWVRSYFVGDNWYHASSPVHSPFTAVFCISERGRATVGVQRIDGDNLPAIQLAFGGSQWIRYTPTPDAASDQRYGYDSSD